MMPNTKKLNNEKKVAREELVRKLSIREWSPMRCMISPVFFESKKRMGSFSNLKIKSEISATFIRVLICVNVQLRMKPTDNWLVDKINCVTNIRIIKFKLLFNTPTSIID